MRAFWVIAAASLTTVAGWPLFLETWLSSEPAKPLVAPPPMFAVVRESLTTQRQKTFDDFLGFMEKYHKKYDDETEVRKRFEIFAANMETAAKNSAANKEAEFGVTKFSDLSPDEFLDLHTGHLPLAHETEDSAIPANIHVPSSSNLADLAIPSRWDWRDDAIIGPVKDMGKCTGGSYAFAALAAFEAHWAKKTGNTYSLSEQLFLSCNQIVPACGKGHPSLVYSFIQDAGFVARLADLPFKSGKDGKTPPCQEILDELLADERIPVYANGTQLIAKDEDAILQALANAGPVVVAISPSILQTYKRGVIVNTDNKIEPKEVTHAVLLVGYGTEGKNDYYIARNSMGPDWGEDGYLRIRRKTNSLGIKSWAGSYPIIN